MSRRANPRDAAAESPIEAPKLEAVHATEHDALEDVAAELPRLVDGVHDTARLRPAPGPLGPARLAKTNRPAPVQPAARSRPTPEAHSKA